MDAATRDFVRRRAQDCCEYCRLPASSVPTMVFHVEHVIARQHGGADDAENLAWSCSRCNCVKGPNLASLDPSDGAIVELFHPRRDAWKDHFAVVRGKIMGLTAKGRATVQLLGMNEGRRLRLRRELIALGEFRES